MTTEYLYSPFPNKQTLRRGVEDLSVPKGKPTSIILLSEHSIGLLSKIILCLYVEFGFPWFIFIRQSCELATFTAPKMISLSFCWTKSFHDLNPFAQGSVKTLNPGHICSLF